MPGWFRFQNDYFTHPKILDAGWNAWHVHLYAIAVCKQQGFAGKLKAHHLAPAAVRHYVAAPEGALDVEQGIEALERVGLFVRDEDGWTLPNWRKYEYDATNAERQRRHRKRKKQGSHTPRARAREAEEPLDDPTGSRTAHARLETVTPVTGSNGPRDGGNDDLDIDVDADDDNRPPSAPPSGGACSSSSPPDPEDEGARSSRTRRLRPRERAAVGVILDQLVKSPPGPRSWADQAIEERKQYRAGTLSEERMRSIYDRFSDRYRERITKSREDARAAREEAEVSKFEQRERDERAARGG